MVLSSRIDVMMILKTSKIDINDDKTLNIDIIKDFKIDRNLSRSKIKVNYRISISI